MATNRVDDPVKSHQDRNMDIVKAKTLLGSDPDEIREVAVGIICAARDRALGRAASMAWSLAPDAVGARVKLSQTMHADAAG